MNAYRLKPLRYPWPPVLYGMALLLALVAAQLAPLPMGSGHPWLFRTGGLLLFIAAVLLDIWAMKTLFEHQTPFTNTGCARHLVKTGPYRLTRNPIYLGYTLATIGLGLMMGNGWLLLAALLAAIGIRFAVIRCEEQHLLARFGIDYEYYCRRTRRWI
ncbi:methyltransferase family protein [Rhizobium sp. G187]|uniref:methyltransferase family protein n=1 Tax=Rhizobium sp. G187 TaxID=3451352 RepID=UPI003EE72C56